MSDDWEHIRAGRVVFEDEAALVLNKPAGVAVMGERHETDLVRIARDAGERLFPVHRIDKVTSGAVLFARQLHWHGDLTRQFARRGAGKAYLAIVRAAGVPARGTIDLPLSTGRKNRVRVAAPRAAIVADRTAGTWTVPPPAIFGHVRTYPSLTLFARIWQDGTYALLVVWPVTGRRHQIRVHLAWTGFPVAGDPLFPPPRGTAPAAAAPGGLPGRALLHSWRLGFDAAWRDGGRIVVEAPPGEDFWAPVAAGLPGGHPGAVLAAARRLTAAGSPA